MCVVTSANEARDVTTDRQRSITAAAMMAACAPQFLRVQCHSDIQRGKAARVNHKETTPLCGGGFQSAAHGN